MQAETSMIPTVCRSPLCEQILYKPGFIQPSGRNQHMGLSPNASHCGREEYCKVLVVAGKQSKKRGHGWSWGPQADSLGAEEDAGGENATPLEARQEANRLTG